MIGRLGPYTMNEQRQAEPILDVPGALSGSVAFNWLSQATAWKPLQVTIEAETCLGRWNTFSGPAEFQCSDGKRRVLKALRSDRDIGRALFNDQTVARMGAALGAPVGDVALVNISPELIAINPDIAYMRPGVAHATLRIPDVSQRIDAVSYAAVPENGIRYATLAILYGWIGVTGDRQFVFGDRHPNLVYSVDHGHFFPGGPNWSKATLDGTVHPSMPAADLLGASSASLADLDPVYARLSAMSESDILGMVMAAPSSWGVDVVDRIALAQYLWRRLGEMLANNKPTGAS